MRFGGYEMDGRRRALTRRGTPITLTPKAYALLEALIAAAPGLVAKERLYDTLWPEVFVEMGNLYSLVAEIRNAAGDDAIIRTMRGFGYTIGYPVDGAADAPAAQLVVGERSIALRSGETVVGRDLLGSRDVSRRHARIVLQEDGPFIEDLASKNGTWVNGRRIAGAEPLRSGDAVTFGLTRGVVLLSSDGTTLSVDTPPAS